MIPNEILEKARKGGWMPKEFRERTMYNTSYRRFSKNTTSSAAISSHEIALDPEFWRCLGKATGLGMELGDRDNNAWKYKALHFCELIYTQAPQEQIDAFWKDLQGKE